MKKRLPLALTLGGVACLISVAVYAASTPAAPKTAPHQGDKFAALMAEKLGLTPEQKSKIDVLREEGRAAFAVLQADQSLSTDDRRAKGRALFEAQREKMKAVLTPEQQVKAAQAREHFMGNRPHGPGGPGMGRHDQGPKHFKQHHQPNPERMRFMAERAHKMMERMHERRADMLGLTDDQRAKMRLLAFQHHEKEIALQKGLRAEMEAVLTPEQKAKAKEMKERHGEMRHGPHGPQTDDDDDDDDRKGPPPGH